MQVHYFDTDGFYTHSVELPTNPVTGKPFDHNPDVCTPDPLPQYDPETERVRCVDDAWMVEAIPLPEPEPEPEPPEPQCPRFVGNQKLDLFTQAEQLAVVTATMSDPLVKLMYDRMIGSAYMSYEDPETEAGLSLLCDKGLLTPERKVEIVSLMQAS
ncbi:hypothetical protein [Comamonas jiangduensis]|uniref:hypothetical protein n=1 Tax=Comamonas jiangduensis TaxID=1194168 RepID=UPI001582E31A|nr:hypothetical protein [Comamonas jiangduensis]